MEFLPLYEFRKCVQRYQGEYKARSFSCMDQFLCMAFAQLTYRESLRDIESCLRFMRPKLYHMGFRGPISKKHISRCKQSARLAYLCRLCPGVNSTGQKTVFQRTFWRRIKAGGLRAGCHNNRFMSIPVPLGAFSKDQSRGKTAYAPGSTRQYPDIYPNHRRKKFTMSTSWTSLFRKQALLYYGQGLHRFCPALCPASRQGVFHRARQIQYSMPKALFSPCGQTTGLRCDQTITLTTYQSPRTIRKNSALSNFSMPSTING